MSPARALAPALLLLTALSGARLPMAGAADPEPRWIVSATVPEKGTFRGFLAHRLADEEGPEQEASPAEEQAAAEIRKRLDLYLPRRIGDTRDIPDPPNAPDRATYLRSAVDRWEALTGPAGKSASGRLVLCSNWTGSAAAQSLARSTEWLYDCEELELLTGEARFGDALEETLYRRAEDEIGQSSAATIARDLSIFRFYNDSGPGIAVNLFETTSNTVPIVTPRDPSPDGTDRPSQVQPVTVHVLSRFPAEGKLQVQFRMPEPARFALWLRVPAWAPEMTIRSLATNEEVIGLPGDWARLGPRTWQGSDWVEVTFPLHSRPAPSSRKEVLWGPLRLPADPAHDATLREMLDPGVSVTNVLDDSAFPAPVARPSRPAHPEGPFPPGKTAMPAQERRGWYTWLKWEPDTWQATVGSEPPGQTWRVRILPWASTIRHMVYGARPDDLLPGERVNIFLGAGPDGEWSTVTYFQDELMQMRGHGHWWWVRSVDRDGRGFTARLFTSGDNLLHSPEVRFEVDPHCECWQAGKIVRRYPLHAGERVRMISEYRGAHLERAGAPYRRVAVLLADDASLDAIRDRKQAAERKRIAEEGLAGFVDRADAETAQLTIFSTYWPYGHELKPGQKVLLTATGPGQRPTGRKLEADVVSAHVGGQYGSGDTAVELRGPLAPARAWTGGTIVRLIPE